MSSKNTPNVLIFDIETAPIIAHVWSIWQQNVSLNQIQNDWHLMSWSAKWLEGKDGTVYGPHNKVMYMDQRNAKNISDDRLLLKGLWALLDKADVVITQNGDAFDIKKIYARFIMQGFTPPSSFKSIDTKKIAKSRFGFTSNRLEYMSCLNVKFKKQKHSKFPGHEMWTQCMNGNLKAWEEMEKYNKYDVLSLEELYLKFHPWFNSFDPTLYSSESKPAKCLCGSIKFSRNGFCYTSSGKYQRFTCSKCGAESRGRQNMLSMEKRSKLRAKISSR